jgi:hypothetical protein
LAASGAAAIVKDFRRPSFFFFAFPRITLLAAAASVSAYPDRRTIHVRPFPPRSVLSSSLLSPLFPVSLFSQVIRAFLVLNSLLAHSWAKFFL